MSFARFNNSSNEALVKDIYTNTLYIFVSVSSCITSEWGNLVSEIILLSFILPFITDLMH